MKLTVSCQICGEILAIVEKDSFTDDDINMYEQFCFCNTLGPDGVTPDGQTNIQATKTID
jgi:hypothetical protein